MVRGMVRGRTGEKEINELERRAGGREGGREDVPWRARG